MNKENRVYKYIIKKNHKMFEICNLYCKFSKNLYNHANYIVRQEFIKNHKFIQYQELWSIMKTEESFKTIGSNSGQHTLKILERNWKSFFVAIKDWSNNPHKYLGKPNLPKYLDKDKGRFVCVLTNMQTQIKDGYLYFAFKPFKPFNETFKVNFQGKHQQTRIIPKKGYYVLEIVYEIEIGDLKPLVEDKVISIDLGLNNLMTVQNNFNYKPFVINGKPIKSINQYYNMKKAKFQSKLIKSQGKYCSNRLNCLTMKRDLKVENYLHKASRYIVNYCISLEINTVVLGKNDNWKQEFKRRQNFSYIPFEKLIYQLQYKLREAGILLIITEESYTSKASFLDNDEMKKGVIFSGKRIKRGLYRSEDNTLINADINGASNIMRKVFPNCFENGIEDVGLHPVIINV